MKTDQELFDIAVTGTLTQPGTALNNTCVYRTKSGMMCAVGHIIKDNYTSDVEGSLMGDLVGSCSVVAFADNTNPLAVALRRSGVTRGSLRLLYALQSAHDGAITELLSKRPRTAEGLLDVRPPATSEVRHTMAMEYMDIASAYGLSPAAIDAAMAERGAA